MAALLYPRYSFLLGAKLSFAYFCTSLNTYE
jgi:hypothetical protein